LSAARERYLGVDTFKELFENVESRNIIAFIKDTNFHHYILHCFYISLIALILPRFYLFDLSHKLSALTVYGTKWPILR